MDWLILTFPNNKNGINARSEIFNSIFPLSTICICFKPYLTKIINENEQLVIDFYFKGSQSII